MVLDDDERERRSSKRGMYSFIPIIFFFYKNKSRIARSSNLAEGRSSNVEEKPSSSSSVIPKSSSEKDTKFRSRSLIRSAVPDSQLLSFARRPIQNGQGKILLSPISIFPC